MDLRSLGLPDCLDPLAKRHLDHVRDIADRTLGDLERRIPPLTAEELDAASPSTATEARMPIRSGASPDLEARVLEATLHLGITRVRFLKLGTLTGPQGPYRAGPDDDDGAIVIKQAHPRYKDLRALAEERFWVERSLEHVGRETGLSIAVQPVNWCYYIANRLFRPFQYRLDGHNGASLPTISPISACIRNGLRAAAAYPILLAVLGRAWDAERLAKISGLIPDCLPLWSADGRAELTVLVRDAVA